MIYLELAIILIAVVGFIAMEVHIVNEERKFLKDMEQINEIYKKRRK